MTGPAQPIDERSFEDFEVRRAIRTELDVTFVVEAAAGTGKTSELVARLLRVVGEGHGKLENMVAVTFTEKAAGELKLRLREQLERARNDETEGTKAQRFEDAIRSLEVAPIGTIHGLCADILREFPIQAGVDPLFEVADEPRSEALKKEAFERWFEEVLADPPRSVQRVLRSSSKLGPRELLWRASKDVIDRRDFEAHWPLPKGDYAEGMTQLIEQMTELGSYAVHGNPKDKLTEALTVFYDATKNINAARATHRAAEDDSAFALQDWTEGVLRDFASGNHWTWTGFKNESFGPLRSQAIRDQRGELRKAFDLWLKRADAHLASTLKDDLAGVVEAYESLKRAEGVLDFFDLLLRTRDVLEQDPEVRQSLRARYTHLFIDEFQDTDPRQTDILWSLACDDTGAISPGKLFVVGDPKQAIYRFRRADIGVYDRAKAALMDAGARLVHLTTSFRARPEIQSLLNRAFDPAFGDGEAGIQAAHVPLAPARDGREDQPACVVLPNPTPWNQWGSQFWPRDGEPPAVGAFVAWLIKDSGWTVEDKDGSRRPVAAEDVCLLMTRMQNWGSDVAASFTDELERRGIAHVLVAGLAFHDRPEVIAMRAALGAIEWPSDRLRVYATLRGPLFAVDDALLLEWRKVVGSFDPLEKPSDVPEHLEPVAASLRVLAELHILRNHRPAADTCESLLRMVRAHVNLALWPSGAQVLANVARLVELARRHDQSGALSFRSFVEQLDLADEEGAKRESVLLEEGSGGVRVMTVHAAKGLEFPVVVLCDITAKGAYKDPSQYVDLEAGLWAGTLAGAVSAPLLQHRKRAQAEERAEGVRKLYVAATRARDLLVLPGIGDYVPEHDKKDYWVEPLMAATTPAVEHRKAARPAPACPPFKGDDTVMDRPGRDNSLARQRQGLGVRPGLQSNGVVWWDPLLLDAAPPPRKGLRGAALLKADGPGAAAADAAYDAFCQVQDTSRQQGLSPTVRARTATSASKIEASKGRPITIVTTDAASENRPAGARFGTLVHALLADAPFDADAKALAALARFHSRALGATAEEESAAAHAAQVALAHPILQRAQKASDVRREVMLVHRQVDGAVLEGVADLVFLEDDPFGESSWTVVDFKTDLEDDVKDAYRVQIELYAEAVEAATGTRCEAVLMGV